MSYAAFWSASTDGSSWYRCELPGQSLRWAGHKVWIGELLPISVRNMAQTIIGSRIAQPEASENWQTLARRRDEDRDNQLTGGGRPGGPQRLILDLDDDYFAVESRNRQAYSFWSTDQAQWRLIQNCAVADVVTCASPGIADAVERRAASVRLEVNTVVIPNGLHATWLARPRDYDPPTVTYGWAGTHGTAEDFDLIARSLGNIIDYANHREDGFAKALLIGMPIGHPHLDILAKSLSDPEMVDGVDWINDNNHYLAAVANFDIWLAPYRSSPFTEAKFPTKALEAGMLGIPLIATDIRPYREWIEHGVNGFLVPPDQPWFWSRHLKTLTDAPALRQRMGEAARSRAALNSLQSIAKTWEQVAFW